MDVYDASANMIAFSEFVVAAAKSAYGGQVEARAQVSGFGRGSFVTDLVFNLAGPAATIFAAITPESLLHIIKEAIALWKHLNGEPPSKIEHHVGSQELRVTNNNGTVLQVHTETLNLVFDEKGSASVQRFMRDELSKNGIDSVEIGTEKRVLASATQNDAHCFVPVRPTEVVTDSTIKMALVIEAPVFKDGNKWRFSDGTSSFFADILDLEFLARVDAGERFGKGDVLIVALRITQERSGLKITAERSVVKVLEHRQGQEQHKLF